MSRKQTQFIVLPNEVIYSIFGFLTDFDILRAFAQLNRRYDDLVRFYVKQIDLTDGWQGNRQQLQWIRDRIQLLIVDHYYIHLLDEPDNRESITSSPIEQNLLQLIKKHFTLFQNKAALSQCYLRHTIPVADYQFPRLHSLQLINVYDWTKVISNMNLKSLGLWFSSRIHHYDKGKSIPQTIIRFSSNAVLEASNFHTNLIDLSVGVHTVVQLVEIVEHTPNIQHLRVTFAEYFDKPFFMTNYLCRLLETVPTNFRRLDNLRRLCFSTEHSIYKYSNERLPFNQIQLFIDRFCPDKTILKKVALKLDHIIFREDMWSTIVRYKNTFDRFDFYASFIADNRTLMRTISSSVNDLFDYHIEDGDPSYSQPRFVHVHSLPFAFDNLHGFNSYSELSYQSSFSAVRHLYLTPSRLVRPISFESLTRRMPYLISINCNQLNAFHNYIIDRTKMGDENIYKYFYDTIVPEIIVDRDIFNYVRFFRFTLGVATTNSARSNLLSQLLDRMPHLQCLITSDEDFIHTQRPLSSLKRLNLRLCNSNLFDFQERNYGE